MSNGAHQATTVILPETGDTAAVVAIRSANECVKEAAKYMQDVVDTFLL